MPNIPAVVSASGLKRLKPEDVGKKRSSPMHRMRCHIVKVGLTLLLLTLLGRPAMTRADLIRPDAKQSFPDLASDIVGAQTYTFDSSTRTGLFQVNNNPAILALGPTGASESYVYDPAGGAARSQLIQIRLDAMGKMLNDPGNSYSLYGSVQVAGKTYAGLLLQGTPTRFGFASPNPQTPGMSVYDLNMNLTGGLLQQAYGKDAYIRIIAEANSSFDGSFDKSFLGLKALTNVRAYDAPFAAAVPEPSAFAILLVCGGAGLLYHRRRSQGNRIGRV